jgi:hypothetical protein
LRFERGEQLIKDPFVLNQFPAAGLLIAGEGGKASEDVCLQLLMLRAATRTNSEHLHIEALS